MPEQSLLSVTILGQLLCCASFLTLDPKRVIQAPWKVFSRKNCAFKARFRLIMGPIFEGEEKGTFEFSSFRMHERGCSKRAGKKVDERDVNFFFRESEKGPKI